MAAAVGDLAGERAPKKRQARPAGRLGNVVPRLVGRELVNVKVPVVKRFNVLQAGLEAKIHRARVQDHGHVEAQVSLATPHWVARREPMEKAEAGVGRRIERSKARGKMVLIVKERRRLMVVECGRIELAL